MLLHVKSLYTPYTHICEGSCTFAEQRFQACCCMSRACTRHIHISAKEVVPLQSSASKHAAACQEPVHAIYTYLRRKLYLCRAALSSMQLHVKSLYTPYTHICEGSCTFAEQRFQACSCM